MKTATLILMILVGTLNIALNTTVKDAAKSSDSYFNTLISQKFLLAFGIGCLSVLSLVAVYSTGIELPRGILLMGVISIIGGSLWGEYKEPKTLTEVEWLILGLVSTLFAYRAFFKS